MMRPWTAVIYDNSVNVTYVTNELAPYEPSVAKQDIEATLTTYCHVLALIPGAHAAASSSFNVHSESSRSTNIPNCS